VIKADDVAQTRAAMRALGVQKIVVTPTADGWMFSGDGNLAGMISGNRVSRGAPQTPSDDLLAEGARDVEQSPVRPAMVVVELPDHLEAHRYLLLQHGDDVAFLNGLTFLHLDLLRH